MGGEAQHADEERRRERQRTAAEQRRALHDEIAREADRRRGDIIRHHGVIHDVGRTYNDSLNAAFEHPDRIREALGALDGVQRRAFFQEMREDPRRLEQISRLIGVRLRGIQGMLGGVDTQPALQTAVVAAVYGERYLEERAAYERAVAAAREKIEAVWAKIACAPDLGRLGIGPEVVRALAGWAEHARGVAGAARAELHGLGPAPRVPLVEPRGPSRSRGLAL